MASNVFDQFDGAFDGATPVLPQSPAEDKTSPSQSPQQAAVSKPTPNSGNVFDQFDGHLTSRGQQTGPLVDYARSDADVRSDIAKLPENYQPLAMRQWADTRVAKRGANIVPEVLPPIVGPLAEKATAGVNAGLYSLTGGTVGRPYSEGRALQEAQHRADYAAHPIADTVVKLASGVLLPIPGAPAETALGRIGSDALLGGGIGATDAALQGDTDSLTQRGENAVRGGIGGVIVGGGLRTAGETIGSVRQVLANRGPTGAYSEFAKALPDADVGTFANQVATGSSRYDQAINRRTFDVLGEEMARTPQNRVDATRRTIDRLVSEYGVAPSTARDQFLRLSNVNRDSELFLGEAPAAALGNSAIRSARPENVDLDAARQISDAGTHWQLDTLANGSGQSATTIRNAVSGRALEQPQVMSDVIDSIAPINPTVGGGGHPMTIEDTPALIEAGRQAARQAYARAEQNQQPFNDRLENVLDTWYRRYNGQQSAHADAVRSATDVFRNEVPLSVDPNTGEPVGTAMVAIGALPPPGQAGPLRDFINRRGQLNDMIDKSLDQFGQPLALTRDLTRLKGNIDSAVGVSNPDWRTANRQWADMKLEQVAQRLGDALSTKAGPQFRQQVNEFDNLAPQAQDIVKVHFLQKLKDKLENLGDNHDVSKIFNSEHVRMMVREMFGPNEAIRLTKAVRDAAIATKTNRMMGGSPTQPRQARQAAMDAETGIIAAVDQASLHGARNAILKWAAQKASESRRSALAEIATTPLRDTAEVARHVNLARQAQARQQQLAQPVEWPTAMSGGAASVVGDALHRIGDRNGWEKDKYTGKPY